MRCKMECEAKWNAMQNGMRCKMECEAKWNAMQNGMRSEEYKITYVSIYTCYFDGLVLFYVYFALSP